MEVVEIWVDTALQLSEKNLRLMEYLVRAQSRRWSSGPEEQRQVAASAAG
jgi:DSF synthase